MQSWRILLIVVLVIILIPTYMLMKRVEELKQHGSSNELTQKQKQLKWCVRLLIALFLVVLGVSMYEHYARIAENW